MVFPFTWRVNWGVLQGHGFFTEYFCMCCVQSGCTFSVTIRKTFESVDRGKIEEAKVCTLCIFVWRCVCVCVLYERVRWLGVIHVDVCV